MRNNEWQSKYDPNLGGRRFGKETSDTTPCALMILTGKPKIVIERSEIAVDGRDGTMDVNVVSSRRGEPASSPSRIRVCRTSLLVR